MNKGNKVRTKRLKFVPAENKKKQKRTTLFLNSLIVNNHIPPLPL